MGFKLKLNNVKVGESKITKKSKLFKVSLVLGIVVVAVLLLQAVASFKTDQVVQVVKLSTSIPAGGIITESNMVPDDMLVNEYEKQAMVVMNDGSKRRAIVLWEDRAKILNTYASYYIRHSTPIYWDSLSKESSKKYAYLYQMEGELLRVDINAKEFGNMLVPGDKINIRATYTENEYKLPSEKEFLLQQQMGIQPQTTVTKNIKLFSNVSVLDILNSKGDSIFDIYYNLLELSKAEQEKLLNNADFQNQIVPSQILLNVTPEEADRYISISNSNPKLVMTLLPRTSGNLITEALNELNIGTLE